MPMLDSEGFTEVAMDPNSGDDKLWVRFHVMPLQNQEKSAAAGRPIYEDKEFIEIRAPGDNTSVILRVADEFDKRRFARRYSDWKAGRSQEAAEGTPLSVVPWLSPAQREELAFYHVRTVEHLANLADSNAQGFPGIQNLKQKAKEFLAAAAGAAPVTKMQAELDERDKEIAALKRQLDEQASLLTEVRKALPVSKRG